MEQRSRPPSVPPSPPRRQAARLEASDDAARTSRAATDDDEAMGVEGAVSTSTLATSTVAASSLGGSADVGGNNGDAGSTATQTSVAVAVTFTASGVEADKARLRREWEKVVEQLRTSREKFTVTRSYPTEDLVSQSVTCTFSLDEEGRLLCHQHNCPKAQASSSKFTASANHANDHLDRYHKPERKRSTSGRENKAASRSQKGIAGFFLARPTPGECLPCK